METDPNPERETAETDESRSRGQTLTFPLCSFVGPNLPSPRDLTLQTQTWKDKIQMKKLNPDHGPEHGPVVLVLVLWFWWFWSWQNSNQFRLSDSSYAVLGRLFVLPRTPSEVYYRHGDQNTAVSGGGASETHRRSGGDAPGLKQAPQQTQLKQSCQRLVVDPTKNYKLQTSFTRD